MDTLETTHNPPKIGILFDHFELSIWGGHDSILKITAELRVNKKVVA